MTVPIIKARREVLVYVPTYGKLWRLGDLRAMLQHEAVRDLDDSWVLTLQEGDHGHSIRFMEPEPDEIADRERIARLEQAVGPQRSHPNWNLETTIDEMDLTIRTYNCLKRENIDTIDKLVRKSPHDLLDIRNFGERSVAEVQEKLTSAGFSLRPNDPAPVMIES